MNNRSHRMKKSILTALIIVAAAGLYSGVQAGQPLILEPLSTTVLSSSPSTYNATTVSGEVKSPIGGGVYEATFTPASALEYGENMVPQKKDNQEFVFKQNKEVKGILIGILVAKELNLSFNINV